MKTYNENNCSSKVRATFTDILGREISLLGKYAHSWQVAIKKQNNITLLSFTSRIGATKEFNKLKRYKKQLIY